MATYQVEANVKIIKGRSPRLRGGTSRRQVCRVRAGNAAAAKRAAAARLARKGFTLLTAEASKWSDK